MTKYKARVYLTQPVKDHKGLEGIAVLDTFANEDISAVRNFVHQLSSQGVIQAYRILFNPNGNEVDWYNDSEVKYLPDGSCPIFNSMPC